MGVEEKPICECCGKLKIWKKDARLKMGGYWACKSKALANVRKYNASPKGKAARHRYNTSPSGKKRHRLYRISHKGWWTARRRQLARDSAGIHLQLEATREEIKALERSIGNRQEEAPSPSQS